MDCKKKLDRQKTGEKIYRAIEKSGYTNEQVAEELGLTSPRVIYEWASGKKIPSLERIINLSLLLDVRIEDLLSIE